MNLNIRYTTHHLISEDLEAHLKVPRAAVTLLRLVRMVLKLLRLAVATRICTIIQEHQAIRTTQGIKIHQVIITRINTITKKKF